MSHQLHTNLLGRRCRPLGSTPAFKDTRPEDYYLEIVAVATWTTEVIVYTVDVRDGQPSEHPFRRLEFEPSE